jgi:NTE family protein
MEDFKRAYFKMLADSKIKEIIPQAVYNRRNRNFDLYLDVKVKEDIDVGIGGNISSHQANQLFLSVGYQGLREYAGDLNATFQMGNSYSGVALNGGLYLSTRIPAYLNLQTVYSYRKYSESQSLFYEDLLPAFIKQREAFAKLKLGFAFLKKSKAEIGLGYGRLRDDYFQTSTISFINSEFDRSWYDLFQTSLRIERNSLNVKQYPTGGRHQFIMAQFLTGSESYKAFYTKEPKEQVQNGLHWLQVKGKWENYSTFSNNFRLGLMAEAVLSTKKLLSNYTASILQAPAFTPTPHSKIVFNEAFRANQYVAAGITPIFNLSKTAHLRTELYGFLPVSPIKREVIDNNPFLDRPYYGKTFDSLHYMGEVSLVFNLPFVSVGLFVNGYSYPKNNFNIGLNIGYLLFNSGFLY